ncbi:hypothetical protein DSECCO2_562240 [anaerobic digester metagenome]
MGDQIEDLTVIEDDHGSVRLPDQGRLVDPLEAVDLEGAAEFLLTLPGDLGAEGTERVCEAETERHAGLGDEDCGPGDLVGGEWEANDPGARVHGDEPITELNLVEERAVPVPPSFVSGDLREEVVPVVGGVEPEDAGVRCAEIGA